MDAKKALMSIVTAFLYLVQRRAKRVFYFPNGRGLILARMLFKKV